MNRSIDQAVNEVLANHQGGCTMQTAWDRYEAQLPQCGFGELGLCCRHCMQGPCRIDPFGEGPQRGVCGADADTIVARGLARAVAGGTASHSGHARHLAHVLHKIAAGKALDYPIRDEAKLKAVAARIGIATEGRSVNEIAHDVAAKALAEFGDNGEALAWAATTMTKGRIEAFSRLGIVPTSIDGSVAEVMHRTTYGVDADPVNILLGALQCALADYAACHLAADLADIIFGTPQPVVSRANLGVIKADAVNIALHGHNPLLSDIIAQVASEPELIEAAKQAGGLNVIGICCTGNEVMMRHGIPLATSSVSQEVAIMTGALDAMVVDYQCIMPAVATAAECFHTKLITTMPIAKLPGAEHVEFREETAADCARAILRQGIERFKLRRPDKVCIPAHISTAIAGFSAEAIIAALATVNAEDPLKPLIDNIVASNIRGICLFAGCNSVKVPQDRNSNDVIVMNTLNLQPAKWTKLENVYIGNSKNDFSKSIIYWRDGNNVKLWHVSKGEPVLLKNIKLGNKDKVSSSADMQWAVIWGPQRPAELWDLKEKKLLRLLTSSKDKHIQSVKFSINDTAFVIYKEGSTASLFDAKDGTSLAQNISDDHYSFIYYDPDLRRIHLWNKDGQVIRLVEGRSYFGWFRPTVSGADN